MNEAGFRKYLARNPLTRPIVIGQGNEKKYRNIVVIPACDELDTLPLTLNSLSENPAQFNATAVIVVVNNSPEAVDSIKIANLELIGRLVDGKYPFDLIVIDACSPGYEVTAKGGVGDARKIGMDAALNMLDYSLNVSPLLFCLDADTLVEKNYIAAGEEFFMQYPNAVAGVFRVIHQAGETVEIEEAIRSYELYMDEFVKGLEFAGSPYAYHAIGSAIICPAEAYVKCGGMKMKNGGEDFYFLQALRKLGPIHDVNTTTVHPESRLSDRVAFGTGPRLNRILSGEPAVCHNQEIYEQIKLIMQVINAASVDDFDHLPETLSNLSVVIAGFLNEHNFQSAWQKILNNTPKKTEYLCRAFHTWFDAFRILKFVHYCDAF